MGVTMRGHCCNLICILLLIGVGALVALSVATDESGSSATGAIREVEAPKSNKIFNFEFYKRTFGKHYKSLLEELSRRRLFLSSALRAFASKIKYKYKLSPYYLAVNNLSDRSPEERDRMRNKYAGLDESETPTNDSSMQDETIANENKTVEKEGAKELESLGAREHSDSEPGYRELREALADKQPGQSRKKRDIETKSPGRGLEEKLIKSQQVCGLSVQQEELTWLWLKSNKGADSSGSISKDRVSGAIETKKLPDKVFFDHRDSGCLLPPRHQGDCGCCYAFASIAMMEWLYCKKKGELLAFSEQYMIDCGNKRYGKLMNGCEGSADSVVPMFHHNFGLELAKHYCYRGKNGKCPYEENFDLKKTGYIRMELGNVFKLHLDRFDDYIEHSPIYVAVVTDEEFDAYGGGVDNGARCDHEADHAMLLIGHGREDNTEYWLLRNSYGTDWGVGGYYKLAKSGAGQCMENKGYIFGTKNGKDFDLRPRKTNRVRRNRNHVRLEKPRPIK